jgi:hypothetical protein
VRGRLPRPIGHGDPEQELPGPLVLAALIGVLVSFASWCFLELVRWIQQEAYKSPAGWDSIRSLVVAPARAGGSRVFTAVANA